MIFWMWKSKDLGIILVLPNPPFQQGQRAGKDWRHGFFGRYPDLTIRELQATNRTRAVGFNKPKVQKFFAVYEDTLAHNKYTPATVWDTDETGI